MIKLVAAETLESLTRELDIERAVLGPDVDIVRYAYRGNAEGLVAACRDADVILTDFAPLDRSVIAELTRCRLISIAATGYDCVDLHAAAEANISVCALDDYCTEEVADHTMLLILALSRRLLEYHDQVQSERRWQFDSLTGVPRLGDLTLGIIGFGRIGRAVARRARAFGMTVIACDVQRDAAAADLGVTFCEFSELLATSDVISLHCNLTGDNALLIDKNAFQRMRRKPILINSARGALIDEEALIDALDSGAIAAAGLDVLASESPDLATSKLTGRPNVILTPHVAFYSDRSMREYRRLSASNIRHFLDGEHDKVRKYVHRAGS